MTLRKAKKEDFFHILEIFQQVIAEKVYYSYDENTTREYIEKNWVNEENLVVVAEIEGTIVGGYIIKPNQPGHGAHVANAAYMVDVRFRSHGIGRKLGEHSLVAAKEAGYRAMQYNFVVSTNVGAVKLWQSLGFEIIGTIPEAFYHFEKGYVDAHIMYQKL